MDYEKIASAQVFEKQPYWLPGKYLVILDEVKAAKDRNGVDCFIVTGINLISDHDERPPGMICGWIVKMNKDPSAGNVKDFIAAAMDVELDEVDAKGVESVVSAENPLNGTAINLEVYMIKTKVKKDFSVHNWMPATEKQIEKAEVLKKELGLE